MASRVRMRASKDRTDRLYGPRMWKYGLQADKYVSQNYQTKISRLDENKYQFFLWIIAQSIPHRGNIDHYQIDIYEH